MFEGVMQMMVSAFMRTLAMLLFLVTALLQPAVSSASVISFSDRTVFNNFGVVAFNSNFNDFGSAGPHLVSYPGGAPGVPTEFLRGDVSYHSVGGDWVYGPDTVLTETPEALIGNL